MQVAQDNLCLADCFWNRDEDACPSEVVFATHNHGHATMRVAHPPGAAQAPTMHLWMIAPMRSFYGLVLLFSH